MKQYVEIAAAAKLKLLNEHSIGQEWKSLDETQWCLHWWDENHPKTKAEDKARSKLSDLTESGNPEKN